MRRIRRDRGIFSREDSLLLHWPLSFVEIEVGRSLPHRSGLLLSGAKGSRTKRRSPQDALSADSCVGASGRAQTSNIGAGKQVTEGALLQKIGGFRDQGGRSRLNERAKVHYCGTSSGRRVGRSARIRGRRGRKKQLTSSFRNKTLEGWQAGASHGRGGIIGEESEQGLF
jgi:hypothetical protein